MTFELLDKSPHTITRGRERRKANANDISMTKFEAGLKEALKVSSLSAKTAAKKAGISTSAMGRWVRGALPNIRSENSLAKLDGVVGLPVGTLLNLLRETQTILSSVSTNAFRERCQDKSKLLYMLKETDLLPGLRQQWKDYFDYKIVARPRGLERRANGRWSVAEPKLTSSRPTSLNTNGKKISESANIAWAHISSYLGFLNLSEADGGCGLELDNVQTLGWLAVPESIEKYLEFKTDRSAGLKHGGHRVFCGYIIALTHPVYGYLTQIKDFVNQLPTSVLKGRTWEQLCHETHTTAQAWKTDSKDISRDPSTPLKFFLESELPLKPIFDVMHKLREKANAAPTRSQEEALARRDELILGLLISNPLRAKNIKLLDYKINNSGSMYRTQSGSWRIRIPGALFKNKNRVGNKIYDVPVASWLTKLVDDYINEFRSVLIGSNFDTGYFFVSSHTGGRFDNLNRHVFKITKTYIPPCGGISTHAFRHLVATDWLTKNPNDFVTVAELLNDTIQVVIENYAHLKKDVSFIRYEEYIINSLPQYF